MLFQVVKFDARAPSNDTFDLLGAGLHEDFIIPVWASFSYWVSTSDILAVGAFTVDFQYDDPTGQTRVVNGSPISLQDGTAFFSSPVFQMQRLNATSLAELVSTLAGLAGSSEVSFRMKFSSECLENVDFTDWT